ncbi:MAG: response regulator, partial [Candidatus Omnitrophica bacterium]|nr:response regulator [Candidatus Omnitrophota bacterium]
LNLVRSPMNPKILIIDRSEHFCELIRIRLLNYGFRAFSLAQSGTEGLARFSKEDPQIVLMDVNLGDVKGAELCRRMKELGGDRVKIILMSGMAEPNQSAAAREAGADDYAVKAFDCVDIILAIKRLTVAAGQIV